MSLRIISKICSRIEKCISKRRINPFLTLWLNFRCLPLPQAIKLPIFVYGRPILYNTSCNIIIEAPIKMGMIKFNYQRIWGPSIMNQQSEFNCSGKIIFKGKGYFGTGTKICVTPNAILEFGDQFKVADLVNIGCYNSIKIGAKCRIAHRCQLFDTNYHYLVDLDNRTIKRKTRSIVIGASCWICNSSTISPGTVLPDFTIVGSDSVVNKNYSNIPKYSLIAGIPAKLIHTGLIRIENSDYENQIDKYFKTQENQCFTMPEEWNIETIHTIL